MDKQDGKEFTTTSLEVTTNQAAPSSSSTSSPSSSAELVLETRQDQKWKKPTESWFMVQQLLGKGFTPRKILSILYPKYCSSVSDEIPDVWLLQLIRELCEQRTRKKLPEFNTFEDAVELFRKSSRILVVSGAGVSVSCGIPDFRSENGVYARLKKDFPELPTPSAMFDIDFFRRNPAPFYNFAREIFPGQFRPSVSHMFVKFLEEQGKLLRNYTQNIDTLEQVAGIRNLVECHGSFARSACLQCKNEIDSEEIREQVFSQKIAYCTVCKNGVLKPNIVFFGEDLGDNFHNQMGEDRSQLDLLVVIGSSLQVRPVSLIPYNIDPSVPQILINREVLRDYEADIKLLGSADSILVQIALAMGGEMRQKMLRELHSREAQLPVPDAFYARVKQLASEEPFLPNQVAVDEFKKCIGARANEPPAAGDEQGTENGPTSEKKPKLDDSEGGVEENGEEAQTESSEWQGNYVSVEAHLPSADSVLLVPPHLNVFAGAHLYYDRDQDTFVPRPGLKERRMADDTSSECSDSTSSGPSSEEERGASLPPPAEKVDASKRRAQSCPPEVE